MMFKGLDRSFSESRRRHIVTASLLIVLCLMVLSQYAGAAAQARLKDIGHIVGLTDNQLIGYGVVIGLNGTGDRSAELRDRALANMLSYFGLTADSYTINSKNSAAVILTAKLPPFVKVGDTIDVTVSTLFDAKSLEGGVLLMTQLQAADGVTYAVAQGPVSIGGSNEYKGRGEIENHATVAMIPSGAIVQKDVPTSFMDSDSVIIYSLNKGDFTTASRAADGMNSTFGAGTAVARDAGTVVVNVPDTRADNVVDFIADMEGISILMDDVNKIVINEKTGTVVMGGNITISEAVVAHGNLNVVVAPQSDSATGNTSGYGSQYQVNRAVKVQGASVDDLIKSLNAIGASPRDLIAILQALKTLGALQADIEIM